MKSLESTARAATCRRSAVSLPHLVLHVQVAGGRDEDPGDAGVAVAGRGVQRGVPVLEEREGGEKRMC